MNKQKIKKGFEIVKTGNFRHLLKLVKTKFHKVTYDKVIQDGKINPMFVELVPTLRCNLNCKMCHQRDIRKHDKVELTYNRLSNVLNNLEKLGIKRISFLGGEVFLLKDIDKILELFKEKRFLVTLATNGVLLTDKQIDKIASYSNILQVVFSLDGLEKTHDSIRGLKGAFKRTVNSLKKLKVKGVNVHVVTVIQKDNLGELADLASFVKKELGLSKMGFIWQNYATKKDIDLSKKILEKLSDSEVTIFLSPNDDLPDYSLKEVKDSLKKLHSTADEIGLTVNYNNKSFVDELYDGSIMNKSVSCSALINGGVQVDWHGNVNFCPFIGISKFSNLSGKRTPVKPFNNKLFCDLRQKVLKNNLLPICSRCCSLNIIE